MAALSKVLRALSGRILAFYCPGCKSVHQVNSGWTFNGNREKPTFSPSILVRSGHYMPEHQGPECWCTYKPKDGTPSPFKCECCHSYVEDGNIRFLSDCTHELAGKTVPLPEFNEVDA